MITAIQTHVDVKDVVVVVPMRSNNLLRIVRRTRRAIQKQDTRGTFFLRMRCVNMTYFLAREDFCPGQALLDVLGH